jgi:3-methyl-2-oxobutanoate hydroxymethyltransferase
MPEHRTPVRATDLIAKKSRGEKIAMLTAYDAAFAKLFDSAGVDVILVGDSVGMVVLGHETTIPVTMDAMVHHTKAVVRGARRSLVVADMPFLSYHAGVERAIANAGRLVQEGGAAAVKLEGARHVADAIERIVGAGIPVMGHLGLLPQSVHQTGGFRRQATDERTAGELLENARRLESAGAFAIVLEMIPDEVARRVTSELRIPTIGIGAGPACDGQVLVSYDMLGMSASAPSFVKRYAEIGQQISAAVHAYVGEVRSGEFRATRSAGDRHS